MSYGNGKWWKNKNTKERCWTRRKFTWNQEPYVSHTWFCPLHIHDFLRTYMPLTVVSDAAKRLANYIKNLKHKSYNNSQGMHALYFKIFSMVIATKASSPYYLYLHGAWWKIANTSILLEMLWRRFFSVHKTRKLIKFKKL